MPQNSLLIYTDAHKITLTGSFNFFLTLIWSFLNYYRSKFSLLSIAKSKFKYVSILTQNPISFNCFD